MRQYRPYPRAPLEIPPTEKPNASPPSRRKAPRNWGKIFAEGTPVAGATAKQLTTLTQLWAPMTKEEADWVFPYNRKQRANALKWRLAGYPLPASYLDFIRFSNGGTFRNGDRTFKDFFEVENLRPMMLKWHIPESMPSVLPFAFDGGGVFCAFDMRKPPKNGEFPIVAFHCSTPYWGETSPVADTFVQACRGTSAY